MMFIEPEPTLEHLVASIRVPGMPGVSYAIKVDNPYQSNGNTGELTPERTWTTQGVKCLALTRITAGLVAIFGIRISPEALESSVQFPEYDGRLFPVFAERESCVGMTAAP